MPSFNVQETFFHEFRAMGCQMAAWVVSQDETDSQRQLQSVELLMRTLESRLSRFSSNSELSRLNQQPGTWVRVSAPVFDVLNHALDAARRTGGLFDPTLLTALERAGYDRTFDAILDGGLTRRTESQVVASWREIQVRSSDRSVRIPPGARLDLGGIGKGWAAERAADQLSQLGPCLVDAGGDLAIRGAEPGRDGWQIGIANPLAMECDLVDVEVRDCGVATSGTDFRRWKHAGAVRHHIIDPRTLQPAETDVLTASVIAPNAVEADILAKIVVILGVNDGTEYVRSWPGAQALIVTNDGRQTRTDEFPAISSVAMSPACP